jgi:ABC-type nitrate/sulfonate/bicarbonate transport system substrate-binding protein
MTTTLRLGYFTPSVLLHLAREWGALGDAGLDVVDAPVASSPAQFRSLRDGEFDVVLTSPDNVLAYRFLADNPLGQNVPVEILGAVDRGLGLSLWTGPEVSALDAVREGGLGVDVAQSGFAFVAYALLERRGLPANDYEIVTLGSTPRRVDALVEGACAATILNAGNELVAATRGCTRVANVDELGPYIGTVIAALADGDSERRDAAARLATALHETAHRVLGGAFEREVREAASTVLHLDDDTARAHYACLTDPVTGYIDDGVVEREAMATLIDLRRRFRPAPELDHVLDRFDDVVVAAARPG